MKIGLGSYALAWSIGVAGNMPEHPMDIYQFLDFAHDAGFDLVQIADNLPLSQFSENELHQIKEKTEALDIDIEVGTRGMTIENVHKYLEISTILGSPILRVVIDQQGFVPDLSEIHRIIRELMPELEKRDIRLAIENHDRLKAAQFQEIVETANSTNIGICLDPVNSIGADEGFETVFNALAQHTFNFHLKDYMIQRKKHMMGFDIYGAPAGQGRLNLPYIFSKLQSYGLCHSAILELWPAPEENIDLTIKKEQEWVQQSARFLFDNFKEN
jgi:sugar phosphate isomerase/epimerase